MPDVSAASISESPSWRLAIVAVIQASIGLSASVTVAARAGDRDCGAAGLVAGVIAGRRRGRRQVDHRRGVELRDDLGAGAGGRQEQPQGDLSRRQSALAEVVLDAALPAGELDLELVVAGRARGRAADGPQGVVAVEEAVGPVFRDPVGSGRQPGEGVRSVRAGQDRRFPRDVRPTAAGLAQEVDGHARKPQVHAAAGRGAQAVVVVVDVDETGNACRAGRERGGVGGGAEGGRCRRWSWCRPCSRLVPLVVSQARYVMVAVSPVVVLGV